MTRTLFALFALCVLLLCSMSTAFAQLQQERAESQLQFPSIDKPASRSTQGARDLAIVVAVENYHNLSGVPGAVLSGMDWKSFFSQHLGVPEKHILFLKDHKVTPGKLERAIPRFLKKADKRGRVWFVFIGHGAPFQAVEEGKEISDGLLVGVGAFNDTYEDFVEGSLRESKLEAMLAAGRQKQTIMILDACFSGKTAYNQNLSGTQAVIPKKIIPRVGPNDVVFSAAQHNEVANLLPGNTAKRPAFSYVLLGALRGWADGDDDDQVTLFEAETYVQRALLGLQTPSATVEDTNVKKQALVEKAPEADPGASAALQRVINRARGYAGKACDTKGMVRNADTQGNCCWPGQAYSSAYGSCVGSPMCPDGMTLGKDGKCEEASGEQGYASALERDGCSSAARCSQLADDAYYGRSGARDEKKAAEHYKRACEMGDEGLRACAQYGYMLQYGKGGTKKDERKALALYKKSCTDDVAWGCAGLGLYYEKGLGGLVRDPTKSLSLRRRACTQGSMRGCSHLGYAYYSGEGVPRDYARAKELFDRACAGGVAVACSNIGVQYEHGQGVQKNYARAAEHFKRACEGGSASGCNGLGFLYSNGRGVKKDHALAAKFYEKACSEEQPAACSSLGWLYLHGKGVVQDTPRAAKLYEKACDDGRSSACDSLGGLCENGKGVTRDTARAAKLYEKACDGDDGTGCNHLGNAYYKGKGVVRDLARSTQLYKRACELDDKFGCHNLGLNYYQSKGVRYDRNVARSAFEKACKLGHAKGCANLRLLGD